MRSIKWWCFRWPWVTPNPQTTPIFAFFVAFHIFVVSKHRDFIFGVQVTLASPSRRMTIRPWKGRGYVTWHVLNFGCPIHISGMAEARALKVCPKEDYIKSGQRDDKSPLKGPWLCSRDPFFVCTAVKLETYSPRHSASCYKQCRARRTAVYRSTARWGHARRMLRLRHKLHRFDLLPCLLQTWLFNI